MSQLDKKEANTFSCIKRTYLLIKRHIEEVALQNPLEQLQTKKNNQLKTKKKNQNKQP
jgi:hypothetical protein